MPSAPFWLYPYGDPDLEPALQIGGLTGDAHLEQLAYALTHHYVGLPENAPEDVPLTRAYQALTIEGNASPHDPRDIAKAVGAMIELLVSMAADASFDPYNDNPDGVSNRHDCYTWYLNTIHDSPREEPKAIALKFHRAVVALIRGDAHSEDSDGSNAARDVEGSDAGGADDRANSSDAGSGSGDGGNARKRRRNSSDAGVDADGHASSNDDDSIVSNKDGGRDWVAADSESS